MPGLSCGIVGLPNVGKSTLFNALTANRASASNYPFCTIDPNIGVVEVSDTRIPVLAELSKSKKVVYATMEFVDIAGLVKGASSGEGLGNKFLANIRETDDIVHVVRCFDDTNVVNVHGDIDPIRDIEVINLELILADLQMADNSLEKLRKQSKGKRGYTIVITALERVKDHLDGGSPVRSLSLNETELESLNPYPFLTAKRVLYVANVSDDCLPDMENEYVAQIRSYAEKEGNEVIAVCSKLEEEIAQCDPDDRKELLDSYGLVESGLERLIKASFHMLGLLTFLTTGELESRAWTIRRGTPAPEAAGKIHTDIQRGFIRAEVINYDDMVACNGRTGAKEAGKMRVEGKDYVVKDGDVIVFLHS